MAQLNLGRVIGRDGAEGAVGATGAQGLQGKGYNPKGFWSANTYYVNSESVIDVVNYDGSAYYCKQTHARTITPDLDTEYWGLLVKGGASGEWFFSTNITGTNTNGVVFANSGIEMATVGDANLNLNIDGDSYGNVYSCVVAGTPTTAQWKYEGNITGSVVFSIDNSSTTIAHTVKNMVAKTYTQPITSGTITLPSEMTFGFISEVNFKSGNSAFVLNFTNNSTYPFKVIQYGLDAGTSIIVGANKTVQMSISCDGINVTIYINIF